MHLMAAAAVTTLLGACHGPEDPLGPDEIDVVMSPLTLNDNLTDPGTNPTVCTVGGITMHCCPQWQGGQLHYVMTGLNLAANWFGDARDW